MILKFSAFFTIHYETIAFCSILTFLIFNRSKRFQQLGIILVAEKSWAISSLFSRTYHRHPGFLESSIPRRQSERMGWPAERGTGCWSWTHPVSPDPPKYPGSSWTTGTQALAGSPRHLLRPSSRPLKFSGEKLIPFVGSWEQNFTVLASRFAWDR